MRLKRNRLTLFAIAAWVVALGLTTVLAPVPSEAEVVRLGWMTFAPNHPNGCAPLPFDCYVISIEMPADPE
jgi:hypothetical protein